MKITKERKDGNQLEFYFMSPSKGKGKQFRQVFQIECPICKETPCICGE